MDKINIFLNKISDKFKSSLFWQDKLIKYIFLVNLILNLILGIIVVYKSKSVIPFYNPIISFTRYLMPTGKEIFILPIIGLFIILINLFLSIKIFRQEKFISYLLLGTSLFIQVMLLVTIFIYLLI